MSAKSASDRPGVVQRLRDARSLVILTHARPDGDGLGSMAALARCARAAGKQVATVCPDAIPNRYQFLFADERPALGDRFAPLAAKADAIVLLDARAHAQLDGLEPVLTAHRPKVVAIDHHATGDDIADVQWVDTSAAATGVMIGEVLEDLAWPLDATAAEALATAVVSDTGWLVFANTDGRCLRRMAAWLDGGLRTDKLYRRLYQNDRPQRLALMARMLETLEMHCGGQLAMMVIRLGDFRATGADPAETENLINEPLRIGSVDAVVLLVENDNFIRVSLRSRDKIDVAKIAERFGGGGHARASGFRAPVGDIDGIKRQVLQACTKELG